MGYVCMVYGLQTDIPQEFQQIIEWKSFERAYRKTSDQDKLNIFNIIHSKWPTHMTQARWDGEKDPLCQHCCDREETMS